MHRKQGWIGSPRDESGHERNCTFWLERHLKPLYLLTPVDSISDVWQKLRLYGPRFPTLSSSCKQCSHHLFLTPSVTPSMTSAWPFKAPVDLSRFDDHKSSFFSFPAFLDASTHLYKRLCPPVRPSVRPSVRLAVRKVFFSERQIQVNASKFK